MNLKSEQTLVFRILNVLIQDLIHVSGEPISSGI